MKGQSLLSGKNKKKAKMSSAEFFTKRFAGKQDFSNNFANTCRF